MKTKVYLFMLNLFELDTVAPLVPDSPCGTFTNSQNLPICYPQIAVTGFNHWIKKKTL